MDETSSAAVGPPMEQIEAVFKVYETQFRKHTLVYFGEPNIPKQAVERKLRPAFRKRGYELSIRDKSKHTVLVASRINVRIQDTPWLAIGLVLATFLSTVMAGALHYSVQNPWASPVRTATVTWPFAVSLLLILGVHELGHYITARYHGVRASVPYFIPVPTIIGTLGAVIQIRGRIPDNKALFDIGVVGPIAGLLMAVGVSAVGLMLPPVNSQGSLLAVGTQIEFGYPPLLHGIAWFLNQPLTYSAPEQSVNPIVIAGWVGMFVTFLNLLPVGQIDGGHMLRAMLGRRISTVVAGLVPLVLIAMTALLIAVNGQSVGALIWVVWALVTGFLAFRGPAEPLIDDRLDMKRRVIGLFTWSVGLLCFTPIPIELVG